LIEDFKGQEDYQRSNLLFDVLHVEILRFIRPVAGALEFVDQLKHKTRLNMK